MIILGFSYISIGLTIRKNAKWRKKVLQYKLSKPKYAKVTSDNFAGSQENSTTNNNIENSGNLSVYTIEIPSLGNEGKHCGEAEKPRPEYKEPSAGVPESCESQDNVNNGSSTVVAKDFQNPKKPEKMGFTDQSKRNMRTKALFLITVVFIVMYTPFLILGVFLAVNADFRDRMDDVEITFYRLGMKLIYVNDVVNCFVYGIFDQRFKTHVYQFYRKLFSFFKQHYVKIKNKEL
jgi:hypothetical protein